MGWAILEASRGADGSALWPHEILLQESGAFDTQLDERVGYLDHDLAVARLQWPGGDELPQHHKIASHSVV